MSFTIVQDTREQIGWSFGMYETNGMIQQKLDEGDYTLKELLELEDKTGRKILRIERKRSTAELSMNLGYKWPVFCKELERLQSYEHKALIFEFSIDTLLAFPVGSGIPKSKWYRKNKNGQMVKNIRINGKYMMLKIDDIKKLYGIPVIFAGNTSGAEAAAMELFQKVYDANKEEISQ